jgi:hypothetical protein
MAQSNHNWKQRSRLGLSALELGLGSVVIVVMVCVCLDVCILMLGNQVLDRAARNAARAAAGQSNEAAALNAARAALSAQKTDGYYVSQPVLSGTTAPDFVYQDFGGVPYGQPVPAPGSGLAGNPFVVVNAQCDVRLPASISFLGQEIAQGPLTGGTMRFKRQYTFPIVRQSLAPQFQ